MAAMERLRQRSLFARLALVLLAVLFVAGSRCPTGCCATRAST